jgi:hypothetical protein
MGLESMLIGGGSLALGGISAFGSAQAASAQAKYAGDVNDVNRQNYLEAARARNEAIETTTKQIRSKEAQEKRQQISRTRTLEGRIRTAVGESGLGYGGTFDALMRQADIDASRNLGIIEENAANEIARARSGTFVAAPTPMAPTENPLMAGLMAGLGGIQTGLNMGLNVLQLSSLKGAPSANPGSMPYIKPTGY